MRFVLILIFNFLVCFYIFKFISFMIYFNKILPFAYLFCLIVLFLFRNSLCRNCSHACINLWKPLYIFKSVYGEIFNLIFWAYLILVPLITYLIIGLFDEFLFALMLSSIIVVLKIIDCQKCTNKCLLGRFSSKD